MAERRMFAKTIIDSDAFLDMPLSAQALYFHLSMRADDDGFVNNPKRIQRMIGASEDDCKLLVMKRFIITFESGIIVIKHWCIHNLMRNDRKKATKYTDELSQLTQKENGTYSLKAENPALDAPKMSDDNQMTTKWQPNDNQMTTKWQPNDNQMTTKWQPNDNQVATKCPHRLGKDSIGKYSIVEDKEAETPPSPTKKKKYGSYDNVFLTEEELEKLKAEFPDYKERIERLSEYVASTGKKYKNHLATIRAWARKDKAEKKQETQGSFETDDFFEAALQKSYRKEAK